MKIEDVGKQLKYRKMFQRVMAESIMNENKTDEWLHNNGEHK